jgi:hypothetical protein
MPHHSACPRSARSETQGAVFSTDRPMQNWDMALLKTTKLTESKSLEFRFETFNAFNHAQFSGPTSVVKLHI